MEKAVHYSHQVSFNGASSSWGLLFKANGKINFGTDSFRYEGYSRPALQFAYDLFVKKKVSIGFLFSGQQMGMRVNYLVFEDENRMTQRFTGIDIKVRRRYYGFKIGYHFVNNANHDFYGTLRYGGVFWRIAPSISNTSLDNKLNSEFTGTFFPAIGMGYRYKIKERIGIGIEASLGIPQIFSYGIDYRF